MAIKLQGILLFVACVPAFSQIPDCPNETDAEGRRQGRWCYYADRYNNLIEDKALAYYYRVINFRDDKPVGLMREVYSNGKLKRTGKLLTDTPREVWDSTWVSFREDGSKRSETVYKTGKRISRKIFNPDGTLSNLDWYTLNQEALDLIYSERYRDALIVLEKAKQQADIEADRYETDQYAASLDNMGVCYRMLDDFVTAENVLLESKDLRAINFGTDHPAYGSVLYELASLYLNVGLNFKARDLLTTAKNIFGTWNPNSRWYAGCLSQLARLDLQNGITDSTIVLLSEVLRIKTELHVGQPSLETAGSLLGSLFDLKNSYFNLDNQKASEFIVAADSLSHWISENTRTYSALLSHKADLLSATGNLADAEKFYKEAMEITARIEGADSKGYITDLMILAGFYYQQDLVEKASTTYASAIPLIQKQIKTFLPHLSEREKLSYLTSLEPYFQSFYAFTFQYGQQDPKLLEQLFDFRLAVKGILFQSVLSASNIANNDSSRLADKMNILRTKREELVRAWTNESGRGNNSVDLASLADEINTLEREIYNVVPGAEADTSWRSIQTRLSANEAVIEVVRAGVQYDTAYAALIVTASHDHPVMVSLRNGYAMETKHIQDYRHLMNQKTFSTRGVNVTRSKNSTTPAEVYKAFWEPIAKHLDPSIDRVFFSPDGVYHTLNPITFFDSERKEFLGDRMVIDRVLNCSAAGRLRENSLDLSKPVHLFGDPTFDLAPAAKKTDDHSGGIFSRADPAARLFMDNSRITALPGTKKEVDNIYKFLTDAGIDATQYTGENASEANLKKIVNPGILHIATHGFFLENLRTPEGTTGLISNSFMRSGLLFSGAQQAIDRSSFNADEGIFIAHEALNLDLSETDLVVLSACETGLGVLEGSEGVYGLQRALQQAGAKAIIMSMWQVDDAATAELMILFYKELIHQKNIRAAFSSAVARLKKEYPAPFYWGAFVMIQGEK